MRASNGALGFRSLLASVVVVLVAAACGGNAPTTTNGELTGTLSIYTDDQAPFKVLVPGFTALHPKVTINLDVKPGAQTAQLLEAMIAANSGDDLIFTAAPNGVIPGPLKKGWQPVNKLLTPEFRSQVRGWSGLTQPNGDILGVPYHFNQLAFFYNKALFAKAGLDPNSPPKTFADLLKACKALKAAGITCLDGSNTGIATWLFAALWQSKGTAEQAKDLAYYRLKWTEDPARSVVQRLIDLYKAGYTDPDWLTLTDATFADGFKAGKDAIVAHVHTYEPTPGGFDNIGWFNLGPDGGGPTYSDGGATEAFEIAKWTKVTPLALEFVKYAASADAAKALAAANIFYSTNVAADFSNAPADYQDAYKKWVAQPDSASFFLLIYLPLATQGPLGQGLSGVETGQTDLTSVLKLVDQAASANHF